jgi:hypothetical protein
MTFDRRVADAEFLCRHLGTDKVIVLAESMGTLTGLPRPSTDPTWCTPWWLPTCTSTWPATRPTSTS